MRISALTSVNSSFLQRPRLAYRDTVWTNLGRLRVLHVQCSGFGAAAGKTLSGERVSGRLREGLQSPYETYTFRFTHGGPPAYTLEQVPSLIPIQLHVPPKHGPGQQGSRSLRHSATAPTTTKLVVNCHLQGPCRPHRYASKHETDFKAKVCLSGVHFCYHPRNGRMSERAVEHGRSYGVQSIRE